jgi:predicted nucleic acid-binding protein
MLQQRYVIDASVFVADALPWDLFHADATTLLLHLVTAQHLILTPTIMLAEVAASIARQTDDPATAQQYVLVWQQLPYFQVRDVDLALGYQAMQVGVQQGIRGCDAIYVALAQMQGATLITLDQEQIQRNPAGLTVQTPSQELALLLPTDSTSE